MQKQMPLNATHYVTHTLRSFLIRMRLIKVCISIFWCNKMVYLVTTHSLLIPTFIGKFFFLPFVISCNLFCTLRRIEKTHIL